MKRSTIILGVLIASMATTSFANNDALIARLAQLEAEVQELRAQITTTASKVEKVAAEVLKESEPAIKFSALIEVEYSAENKADGTDSDELAVASVKLNAAATLNQNFDLFLRIKHKNDRFIIDKAILNGHTDNGQYGFSIGRMTVPFGVYQTSAISDTVGEDLGEIDDDALLLIANFAQGFSTKVWGINKATGNNSGVSLYYQTQAFGFGIDWIEDLIAADNENALALHTKAMMGNFTFIVERVAQSGANKVQSTQYEISYAMNDWNFVAVHNNIDNFDDYDKVNTLVLSYELEERATISAEYKAQDRTDNTGYDNATTVQLAYEF